ncbi:MAG: hypothetical protein K8S98_15735, partial [Planctomycetes bacterium]|nr:hypothetical protein [Planctomycetota bacterium]
MLAELVGGLALALFGALPTPREEQELQLTDTKVVVRVATVWPAQLHKGWIPCQVTVTNGEERERKLEIRATAWAIEREVTARVDVPAGSTSSFEMLLPAFNGVQNQFQIGAVLDGKRFSMPGNFGAPEVGQSGGHTVLHLSESEPDPGTTERWTGEV